jgi:uncharacterized surface protein with fasciclin (FAS1) repeats
MPTSRTTRLSALAATAALAVAGLAATPTPAVAGESPSIATLLAADGLELDGAWKDFDILDQAVADVLDAKPSSAVAVLADGSEELTAFAPTDRAFRKLVTDLTGNRPADEEATYAAAAGLGVDTVEAVLLYHVVLGPPITARQAKKADGAELVTAGGGILTVDYRKRSDRIYLIDQDTDDRNAWVRASQANLNRGNPQIAHGISEVLRPLDL